MAGQGGTVHLLVLPNAEDFHNELVKKIKEQNRKAPKAKVDLYFDKTEFDRFRKEVEGTKTAHHIKVFIDDENAIRQLSALEDSQGTIRRSLEMDTSQAHRDLDDFQRRAVNDPVTTYVLADFAEADRNMEDFREKWKDNPVVQRVMLDVSSADRLRKDVFARTQRTAGESDLVRRISAEANRDIRGLINPVEIENEMLDSMNFIPRMLRSMDRQLDIGMRQIYDRYVSGIMRMYGAASKPFLNLRADMHQANNLYEMMGLVGQRFSDIRDKASSFGNLSSVQFLKAAKEMRAFQKAMLDVEKSMSGRKTTLNDRFAINFKAIGAGLKHVADLRFPGLGEGLRDFQSNMRAAFSDSVAQAREEFPKITRFMENSLLRAKYAALGLGSTVGKAFGGIAGAIRGLPEAVGGFVSSLPFYGFKMRVHAMDMAEKFGGALRDRLHLAFNTQIGGMIYDSASKMMRNFVQGFNLDLIANMYKNKMGKFMHELGGFVPNMSKVTDTFRSIGDTASRVFNSVRNAVGRSFSAVGGVLAKVGSGFATVFNRVKEFGSGTFRFFSVIFSSLGRFGRVFGKILGPIARGLLILRGPFRVIRTALTTFGVAAMGVSRIFIGAVSKMTGVLMSAFVPALYAAVAGLGAMAAQTLIGGIMALGGAILAVANAAMVMAPAVAGAALVGFGVLKIGLKDVKSAVSSAFSVDDAAEFEAAIAKMPASVQEVARSFREFKPMMDEMKRNVQDNLLAGLGPKIKGAMNSLLPIFKSGAESIAQSWNRSLGLSLDALSSPQAIEGTQAIMDGVRRMSEAMEPLLANLIKAAGSLAAQGAKFLGPVGEWATNKSEEFFSWAEGLKQIDPKTGESFFDGIVKRGALAASQLSDIFGGVFGTLGNVFRAGFEGGGSMLEGMARSAQSLKEATEPGTEGFAKLVDFAQRATAFSQQLAGVVAPLFGTLVNVMSTLISIGEGVAGSIGQVFSALEAGTANYRNFAKDFGSDIGEILSAAAPVLQNLLELALPILSSIGQGLSNAFTPIMQALQPLTQTLESCGGPVGKILEILGSNVGKIGVALAPLIDSMLMVVGHLLGPLERVAFWIGEIMAKAIEVVSPMLMLRDDAVGGLLDKLTPLVDVLGVGLMGVLSALSPLFQALGQVLSAVLEAVTPLIPVFTEIVQFLFVALIDVINAVIPIIPPLANLIGDLAGILADVLKVALEWVLETFQRVWPAISTILQFAINNVIVPLIHFLGAVFKGLAELIKGAIEYVIIPILSVMRGMFEVVLNFLAWVIDNVAQPAINRLSEAFRWAVDKIKGVWNGLKKIFSDPVRFFIDVVVNKGIVGGWNSLMGLIGQDDKKLTPIALPSEMNFHSGGVLPGMSVGKDNYNFVDTRTGARLGLAGGEGIMRQEFVSAVGGEKGIKRLNEDARHGRLDPNFGAANGGVVQFNFAQGGSMPPMPWSEAGLTINAIRAARAIAIKFPEVSAIGGYRPVDPYPDHPSGRALDVMVGGPRLGDAVKDYLFDNNKVFKMQYALWKQAQWNSKGSPIPMADRGSPTQNHYDHVHAYFVDSPRPAPPGFDFGPVPEGAGQAFFGEGGGGGIISAVMGKVGEMFDGIADKFKASIGNVGMYGDMMVGMAKSIVTHAKEAVTAKIQSIVGSITDAGTSLFGGVPGNVESYREGIIAAFRRQGEDPLEERVNALLRQIQSESQGDPNVAQKIVDVNGTGESAGVGLYQFIPSTFAAFRDPTLPNDRRNVEASHNAAVRYFRDRHNWNTGPGGVGRGHGWFKGGVLPEVFDRGGVANGLGAMVKDTIRPERVLSPAQTEAFNQFVYGFMPELINQFKKNPRDIAKYVGQVQGELKRIYVELREGRITQLQTGIADGMRRRLNGENLQNSPVDLNFDMDWLARNRDNLERSAQRTAQAYSDAMTSPNEFLEAEKRARKQVDEEREKAAEEAKKAEEERKKEDKDKASEEVRRLEEDRKKEQERKEKAQSDADKAEHDKRISEIDAKIAEINNSSGDYDSQLANLDTEKNRRVEEETKSLREEKERLQKERDEKTKDLKDARERQAVEDSYEDKIDAVERSIKDVEKAVGKKIDEQKEVINEQKKAEEDRQREIERAEQERIEKAKADGSYYYGYKVFGEDGTPTDKPEESKQEAAFKDFMSSSAERVGLGDSMSGLMSYYSDAKQIAAGAQMALPAWMAALNGDPSGLAYNVAVGQSRVRKEAFEEAQGLAPSALAGIIEMAVSGSTANSAPFIGEVNSGMTQGELMQTLENYERMRARRGTGTTRVR